MDNLKRNTIQRLIDEAKRSNQRELHLENKTYHIDYTETICRKMNITNTTTIQENPEYSKHFGLLIEGMNEFVIYGNGAKVVFHGAMTSLAIIDSQKIYIKDVTFTFAHPTVTEMTVRKVTEEFVEFEVNPTSSYKIRDGVLSFSGENFTFEHGVSQCYDPSLHRVWRQEKSIVELGAVWEETENKNVIRANTYLDLEENQVIQMRDSIRTEVGMFICRSEEIVLQHITTHFMHGLGVVGQYSNNITIDHLTCIPDRDRTTTGFADFVQISGCKGLFTLSNSRFSGSHDDVVNVHGTQLRITEKEQHSVTLLFMHGQTFGIDVFKEGDMVAAVDVETLQRKNKVTVNKVEVLSPKTVKLHLDSTGFEVGDVVENISCNPDVVMRGNYFECVPTRGVLISTSGRVVIEDNYFNQMGMSAILIADDASSWYESGPVMDVTIRQNTFKQCGEPVILIHPENIKDSYVHQNITITNNQFIQEKDALVLSAKGVDGITFTKNKFEDTYKTNFSYCKNITIE